MRKGVKRYARRRGVYWSLSLASISAPLLNESHGYFKMIMNTCLMKRCLLRKISRVNSSPLRNKFLGFFKISIHTLLMKRCTIPAKHPSLHRDSFLLLNYLLTSSSLFLPPFTKLFFWCFLVFFISRPIIIYKYIISQKSFAYFIQN